MYQFKLWIQLELTSEERIFVPTTRNTLVDILLGRKDPSPKKNGQSCFAQQQRRSRSRSVSVSPIKGSHKVTATPSPTLGKGKKRVSMETTTAIQRGKIAVSAVSAKAARRSPRKKKLDEIAELSEEEEEGMQCNFIPLR